MDSIKEIELSDLCDLILRDDIHMLQKERSEVLLKESTEVSVQLIKLHLPNVKVVCSIQGEDQFLPLLHVAAAVNGVKSIRYLLDLGFHIDQQTTFTKSTALHYAALNDNLDCVMYLLGRNCDVNLRTEFYDNQNMNCDDSGNMCDVNSNVVDASNANQTPITEVLIQGTSDDKTKTLNYEHTEVVLIRSEPESFCITGGATALVLGASNSRIVFELLHRQAKIKPVCEFDRGAMHITALGAAINAAALESVKLLLEAGASMKDICEFNHGHSALDMAICCCKYPLDTDYAQNMFRLVDLLISYGVDLNIVSHDKTLLQNLVSADRSVDIPMMKKLHEAGADYERSSTPNGHTVLSLAILHGKPEQVKLLLNYNCKLNYEFTPSRNDYEFLTEKPALTPLEFSLYLCEKDIEWATSLRSWDPNFFLFLTRQLVITEQLLICGSKIPENMKRRLQQFSQRLKTFRHSQKAEVEAVCEMMKQHLNKISNPNQLQDITVNAIRQFIRGRSRTYATAIHSLGLPTSLVRNWFVERLDDIKFPVRKIYSDTS